MNTLSKTIKVLDKSIKQNQFSIKNGIMNIYSLNLISNNLRFQYKHKVKLRLSQRVSRLN